MRRPRIGLGERVPDHSTISRFRTELVRQDLMSKLFTAVTDHLAQRGYVLKVGTLIDATLIDAAAAEPPKQKGGGSSQADPMRGGPSDRAARRILATSCMLLSIKDRRLFGQRY